MMQYSEASVSVCTYKLNWKRRKNDQFNAIFWNKCECGGCNDTSGVVTILGHFTNWEFHLLSFDNFNKDIKVLGHFTNWWQLFGNYIYFLAFDKHNTLSIGKRNKEHIQWCELIGWSILMAYFSFEQCHQTRFLFWFLYCSYEDKYMATFHWPNRK